MSSMHSNHAARRTRAFTLIELLIVVAILAILAAIAAPNYLEAQTRAKVSRVHADLRILNQRVISAETEYDHRNWTAFVILSNPDTHEGIKDPFTLGKYRTLSVINGTITVGTPGPTRNHATPISITYDPTNGTISDGYILRTFR